MLDDRVIICKESEEYITYILVSCLLILNI